MSAAPVITRFAPSPTGALHLGHAYSAIRAHDVARRSSAGRFILRIDDIDGGRSRATFVDAIFEDLDWLGLGWDAVVTQSERIDSYAAALDQLRGMGLAYPCFCTRAAIAAEIAASASAPHAAPARAPAGASSPSSAAVYPGTCRTLSAEAAAARIAAGDRHCWRLDMERAVSSAQSTVGTPLDWSDAAGIRHHADPLAHGDVVLARKDAGSSYHLASTVDDAALGITHVVRGADLYPATAVHRLLQAVLGLPTPVYDHHPLIADRDGKRLAKRDAAAALSTLRADGVDGRALADALRRGELPIGYTWQSE